MGLDPRVASSAATGVLGMIGRYGADPDQILGAAQLNAAQILDRGSSLELRRYCDLFEQAARRTGVASFGLRFGLSYRLEDMGSLGALLLNAPSLGAALQEACAYFPAIQEHSALSLRPAGELLALEYRITDGRITQRRQDAELSVGIFNNLFKRALGPGWAAEEVHFEHLRACDAGEVRGLLGAPVYFGMRANAILFRRNILPAAMPGAEPQRAPALRAALRRRVEAARPEDFIGQVMSEIRAGFGGGDAGISRVAEQLGFSRAGLYRRLAREGVDFSALTRSVRRELAEMYVAQPGIAFTELAPLLGYSELSAFSRAFTRWTGMSPARYRMERARACA